MPKLLTKKEKLSRKVNRSRIIHLDTVTLGAIMAFLDLPERELVKIQYEIKGIIPGSQPIRYITDLALPFLIDYFGGSREGLALRTSNQKPWIKWNHKRGLWEVNMEYVKDGGWHVYHIGEFYDLEYAIDAYETNKRQYEEFKRMSNGTVSR
ncbi:hypothetical protein OMDBNIEC_00047 [Salmonella phage STP-SP5]|nr:hypothetical protein OMDBNIEC_00047 [Salmonella phage STP-SP5]